MFKPDDKVRIRATHAHCVKGYQIKALGYKRLIGRVTRVIADGSCQVDFTQYEMPRMGTARPGERVRLNKHSPLQRTDGYFPVEMLERAA